MQDSHHKLAVVAQHGTLPRSEAVGFGPAQPNPQAQHALLRIRVLVAALVVDIKTGDSDGSATASYSHQRLHHTSRVVSADVLGLTVRVKAVAFNRRTDLKSHDD